MAEQVQARTGRPRDARIRDKVLLAAQRVYARFGYAGFTFEAIARESGVGKPAIYRRWASKDELMDDVLTSHRLVPERSSFVDVRGALNQIALSTLRLVHSEQGAFILRVSSEREWQPELFGQYVEWMRNAIHDENRSIVVEAVVRGELAESCDPDILINTITGAILVANLMGFAPDPEGDPEAAEDYCRRLVDQVLRGVEVH